MKKELHRLKLDIEKFENKKQKVIQFRDGRWGGKEKQIEDDEGMFDDIIADQNASKPVQELKVEISQLSDDQESLSRQLQQFDERKAYLLERLAQKREAEIQRVEQPEAA